MTKHSMQMCGASPFSSYKATIKHQCRESTSRASGPTSEEEKIKKIEKLTWVTIFNWAAEMSASYGLNRSCWSLICVKTKHMIRLFPWGKQRRWSVPAENPMAGRSAPLLQRHKKIISSLLSSLPLPPPPYPPPPLSPSLISLMVSVEVKHQVYFLSCHLEFWSGCCKVSALLIYLSIYFKRSVALIPQWPWGLLTGMRSPGRPPWPSHSSWVHSHQFKFKATLRPQRPWGQL